MVLNGYCPELTESSSEESTISDGGANGGSSGAGAKSRCDRELLRQLEAEGPLPRVVTRSHKKSVTVSTAEIQRRGLPADGAGSVASYSERTSVNSSRQALVSPGTGEVHMQMGLDYHPLRDHIARNLLEQVIYHRDRTMFEVAKRCSTK
jgi:hypothetical protein